MNKVLRAAGAGLILAATSIAAAQPAEAHVGAGAVIAGIVGLGIGAAIASDHPHYRSVQYYAPPPPPPPYGYGYGYRYGYAPPPPPPMARVCSVRYDGWGYPHRHCWLAPEPY